MRTVIFLHHSKLQLELFTRDWESRFNIQIFATQMESMALKKLKEEMLEHQTFSHDRANLKVESLPPIFVFDEIQSSLKLSLEMQKFLGENPNILLINKLGENADRSFELFGVQFTDDLYKDYLKIKIVYLENVPSSPADLYIKVGLHKYIKVINKEDEGLKEISDHYLEKGIKYFYLKKDDHKKIMEKMAKDLTKRLKNFDSDPKIVVKCILNSVDNIHQSLIGVGLVGDHNQLVQETVQAILHEIKTVDAVWSYVQDKLTGQNYLANHSMAIAFISCSISTKIPELNNEMTRKAFVLAALFHDAYLDEGRLLYMSNIQIINDKNLTSREKRELASHSSEACDLLRTIPNVPPNADDIIWDHHETPQGEVPIAKMSERKTNPLTATFILAEDFYHLCYQHGMNSEAKYFAIQLLKKYYHTGNFKTSLTALEELFVNTIKEDF